MLSRAGANAVLSSYRIALRSLKRGCTGLIDAGTRSGAIVDGTNSTTSSANTSSNSVLDKLPTIVTGYVSPDWMDLVASEFRRGVVLDHASGNSTARERRKLARDYAELIKEIAQHERLLIEFGWGEVRDERSDIRRTARRCGLELSDSPAFGETEIDPLTPTLERIDNYFENDKPESQARN